MYWYYKYPLIILFLLLSFFLCYKGWQSWSPKQQPQEQQTTGSDNTPENGVTPTPPSSLPPSITPPASPQQGSSPTPKTAISAEEQTGAPYKGGFLDVLETPQESEEFNLLISQAERQQQAGQLEAARQLAWKAIALPDIREYGNGWRRAARLLNAVHAALMNSAAPCEGKVRYVIQPGDSLSRIARQKQTTVQALQRINELSKTDSTIHPGNSLQFFEGIWSIRVSKSQFFLSLFLNGKLYRVYSIGIGKQDRTPAGIFEIGSKSMRPTWAPPGREPLPFGHPENIIGTRWMGLTPIEGTNPGIRGYGIHGTIDPDSIGTPSSAGCVRLKNEDVEELFDFIPEQTVAKVRVEITE